MNELALFAGAGGGILGGKLLGWRTICAVEIDQYARSVLVARQNDGSLAPFPIWDDVRTFDGRLWRGVVDVVSGGFPCQDVSLAGSGAGISGARSGLWREMARIIGEVRPLFAWVENSPALIRRGLESVLRDLASMGYDAKWGVMGGHHVGSPAPGERLWVVASQADGLDGRKRLGILQNGQAEIFKKVPRGRAETQLWNDAPNPRDFRMDYGVARRVERIRCIGNGQVPAVARFAWDLLAQEDLGFGEKEKGGAE